MVFLHQDKETYTINQNRQDQVHPSEASCVKTVEKSNNADIGEHLKSSFEDKSSKIVKKPFSNGDANLKSWRGRLPDGKGKYLWHDSCMYENTLDRGKNADNGKVFWTSGATYEGEFSGSNIHGIGTYTRVDGTIYKGNWNMNVKHGVGWKKYANGDMYQGSWRQGVQDGEGRYTWADGTIYMGEWKVGAMCGKGTITWDNGDSYSGQWLDGLRHGHGVYTWSDGGRYAGTWSKGIKHGKGTFYPAGTEAPEGSTALCSNSAGYYLNDVILRCRNYKISCVPSYNGSACVLPWWSCVSFGKLPSGMFSKSSQSVCVNRMLERPWSLEGFSGGIAELGTGSASMKVDLKIPLWKDHVETTEAEPPIVEREYVHGVLISESVKKEFLSSLKGTRHKHCRQVKRPGETIVKGHRSYDLMLSLQIGIRYTISRATPKPKHELKHSDFAFRANVRVRFPKGGSTFTPPHTSVDFKWKDYRPMVFRGMVSLK